MSYTLSEWTEFAENELDRLTVILLPVTKEALMSSVAGHKAHCTLANSLSIFTGMNAIQNKIEIDAQYIKFVLNGKRYFLIHEVVGAEHIKELDELGKYEDYKVKMIDEFKPFDLKLRFFQERDLKIRQVPDKLVMKSKDKHRAVSANDYKKIISKTQQNHNIVPIQAIPRQQRQRIDNGRAKSRWAR